MSIFKEFAVDKDKVENGIPIYIRSAENDDGTIPTFIVKRMDKTNRKFAKGLERQQKTLRHKVNNLDEDEATEMLVDLFCDAVLVTWENVKNNDGSEIPYSKSKAKELLKQLPDLFEFLKGEATEISNFRAEELEEDAKNS